MTAPAANRVLINLPGVDPDAPAAPVVLPPPSKPMPVARELLMKRSDEEGRHLIRIWRGQLMAYQGPHWTEEEKAALRKWVYTQLEHAVCHSVEADGRRVVKPWNPTMKTVNNVIDAMSSIIMLEGKIDPPFMLDTGKTAKEYIPCANGLLDSVTRKLCPATPTTSVPCAFHSITTT